MTLFLEVTEETFANAFKPIANHLNPNASFDWGEGYGTLFETYDEELAYVKSREPSRIWTLLSGDDGDYLYVSSGFQRVNRLGYFICETPVPAGMHILVSLDMACDD